MKTKMAERLASITPDDIERLPRRFRELITTLQDRVREFEKAQASMESTRVIIDPYSEGRRFLPDRTLVRFDRIDVRLTTAFALKQDGSPNALELNSDGGVLNIRPNASNSVYVTLGRP